MFWIEAVAVVFGLACVWLTIRQNIWCWPTGLVQVCLFIFIFYYAKLYSDLILHGVYVVLQIYGWHHWLHGGRDRAKLSVSWLGNRKSMEWGAAVLAATVVWGYVMASWTDAAVPYGDAFTTAASLAAQWLMARKRLESWLFWIAVDVVAVGVYLYKALYLTAGLYAVFFVLAIMGYRAWRASISHVTDEVSNDMRTDAG